jgi:CheY-like chemotaxis protein
MRVTDTRSPAAALRWIGEGRRFDVVLLDQGGPDPGSLADAIHATPDGAAVPIVLLTSFGWVPAPGYPGFAAVLTKPLRPAPVFRAGRFVPDPTRPAPTVGQVHTGARCASRR